MSDCVFCKIITHQAPAEIVYQDDLVTAFHDIRPVAPVHVLIVTNEHIESVNEITPENVQAAGHTFVVARQIAEQRGITSSGYRLIANTGPDSGQLVFHLHVHLIGGRRMRYPIG